MDICLVPHTHRCKNAALSRHWRNVSCGTMSRDFRANASNGKRRIDLAPAFVLRSPDKSVRAVSVREK